MGAKPLIHPTGTLYDEDFVIWAAETANLLRAGRFDQLDIEHLAEEIEDLGKSQRREASSRLTVLVLHLLQWQLQPEKRSGSWKSTILAQRAELFELFEQSPSLRRTLPEAIARIYPNARFWTGASSPVAERALTPSRGSCPRR